MPNKQGGFKKYLGNCTTVMTNSPLTHEELRRAFFFPGRLTKVQATMISLSMELTIFLTLH